MKKSTIMQWNYESKYGRNCEIEADEQIINAIEKYTGMRQMDPEDYFDYIMFAWGNCQAGDRLVMERKLKGFSTEEDLSIGFTPGIRFFFRYQDIIKHPGASYEGVLSLKIRDEVRLSDWVYAIYYFSF